MDVPYDQETLAAAEACFAQASRLLYCEPNARTLVDQVSGGMFRSAPFGMGDQHVKNGMRLMNAWCDECAGDASGFDERVAALKREWFRLLVGAGVPDAPCWESYYRDPNSQVFGKRTLEVRSQYRRHGLQIEKLHAEPDDHLGLMLGFMGLIVGIEADALTVGDRAAAAQAASEQEAFLAEHVLPWLALWRHAMLKTASSDYFLGTADFVFGLCAEYGSRFGIAFDADAQVFKKTRD